VLDRKEQLLTKLRTMNSTAETGAHVDPNSNRPSEAFQTGYGAVLTSLQAVNSEVQSLMARLQGRPHLSASPAAVLPVPGKAADSGGQGLAMTPAITTPSSAAAGDAPADQTAAAAAAGLDKSGSEALPTAAADDDGESGLGSAARRALGAGSAAAAAAAASGILQGATAEARRVVERIRAQQQLDAAETSTSAAAAAADVHQLDNVITGCISMLIMVHQLTRPADGGGTGLPLVGHQQQSAAVVEAALEAALQQLKPKVASNSQEFEHISKSVGLLKSQLAKAH
jgi:hypothetical protein